MPYIPYKKIRITKLSGKEKNSVMPYADTPTEFCRNAT